MKDLRQFTFTPNEPAILQEVRAIVGEINPNLYKTRTLITQHKDSIKKKKRAGSGALSHGSKD